MIPVLLEEPKNILEGSHLNSFTKWD